MPILPPCHDHSGDALTKIILARRDKGHARRLIAILLLHEGARSPMFITLLGYSCSFLRKFLVISDSAGICMNDALWFFVTHFCDECPVWLKKAHYDRA